MQAFIYASIMKMLPDLSPGACSWQKPCLLTRWEVMSRCAHEPALLGLFTVVRQFRDGCLSLSWTSAFCGKGLSTGVLLPITCLSVSTLEAALGACIAPGGRLEMGQRWQGSWGLRILL